MALPKYLKFADVEFKGEKITDKHSVIITIEPQFTDVTIKHDYGDTPVEKVISGYTGKVEVEVGLDTAETFKMTLPVDSSKGDTITDCALGTLIEGGELIIKPRGDDANQIGFFKAIPTGVYSRTFGEVSYNKITFELSVKDGADVTQAGNFFWRGTKPVS